MTIDEAIAVLRDDTATKNRWGLAESHVFRLAEQAMEGLREAAKRTDEIGARARAHLERLQEHR